MSPFMIISVSEAREALFAVSALERLLTSVQAHVHLEVRFLYRSLRAVGASVNLNLAAREVSLLEMALQALVASIAAAAS